MTWSEFKELTWKEFEIFQKQTEKIQALYTKAVQVQSGLKPK